MPASVSLFFARLTYCQGKHRVHVLFSGTCLVTLNETSAADAIPHIPPPPNKGCVAYVLRTGFASSQGSLMQMIEFSQQSVHGDIRETGIALLILLVFALISAAYVMKVGLEKKEKTTHELLLKCVMIITSVIPQQFPMQMAVAVNVALMALMKVFISNCTPQCSPLTLPVPGWHYVHRAVSCAPRRQSRALPLRQDWHSHHRPARAPRRRKRLVGGDSAPCCSHQRQRSRRNTCLSSVSQRGVCCSTRRRRRDVGRRPNRVGRVAGCDYTLHRMIFRTFQDVAITTCAGIAWNWSSDTSVASPGNITGITKVGCAACWA